MLLVESLHICNRPCSPLLSPQTLWVLLLDVINSIISFEFFQMPCHHFFVCLYSIFPSSISMCKCISPIYYQAHISFINIFLSVSVTKALSLFIYIVCAYISHLAEHSRALDKAEINNGGQTKGAVW